MIKTGIYVDAENVRLCGGYGMRYDVLARYASLPPSTVLRANSYVVEDTERVQRDEDYRRKLHRYHNILRSCGFKLIKKSVQRYVDAEGEVTVKADADMDLAIDAILQSRNLDRIIILSGDGDYARLLQALQNKGFAVVEALSPCPTIYGRRNREGGAIRMIQDLKERSVPVKKAAKMEDQELAGKIVTGVLVDVDKPEFVEEYDKLIASLRA